MEYSLFKEVVSFETAKLARKKGFDQTVFCSYDSEGKLHTPFLENGSSTDCDFRVDLEDLCEVTNFSFYDKKIAAPTQVFLQKWLREKNGIAFFVFKQDNEGWVYAYSYHISDFCKNVFKTYDQALEEALKFGLNLLPDKL
jgi:hypothetical protein